jgi:hypothetical protein
MGSGLSAGDLLTRPVEADQGVPQDIVGLLPAGDAEVAFEHLAGQSRQPIGGAAERGLAGRLAAAEAVDAALDDGGLILTRHSQAPSLGSAGRVDAGGA